MLYSNILYTWSKLRSGTPRNFPELYHDSWRQPDPGQVKVVSNRRHEDVRGVSEFSVFLDGQRQWRRAWSKGRGDHTIGLHLPLAPEHKEREILHFLFYLESYLKFADISIFNISRITLCIKYLSMKPPPEAKEKWALYETPSLRLYLFANILLWKLLNIQKSWKNYTVNTHIPTAKIPEGTLCYVCFIVHLPILLGIL